MVFNVYICVCVGGGGGDTEYSQSTAIHLMHIAKQRRYMFV